MKRGRGREIGRRGEITFRKKPEKRGGRDKGGGEDMDEENKKREQEGGKA